ncbi:hypothetical protein [Oleiharenicola lentus]|uniref:hypothetical protein n=1 Tax=Oleiharenicola lentus TaxID=2508720 RepID=UPI003F673407
MTQHGRRIAAYLIALLLLVGVCLIFPRALAFVELAARELRYFWWLILIAALGIWLIFFFKSGKR